MNLQKKFNIFIEDAVKELPFLDREKFSFLNDNILTYTYWTWPYEESHQFQERCVDFIKENKSLKIYIFCNHPHCFTLGRGLQKGVGSALVDFDPRVEEKLKYKVHRIKRGGGLTFHFPGQWIFYPIINLSHPDYNLKEITYSLLEETKKTFEKVFEIDQLDYNRELLGLWRGQKKLASVGIGVKRFVTFHGIAVNLTRDENIFKELQKINPCGLDSTTYQCLDEILEDDKSDLIQRFHKEFTENLHI